MCREEGIARVQRPHLRVRREVAGSSVKQLCLLMEASGALRIFGWSGCLQQGGELRLLSLCLLQQDLARRRVGH